MRRRHNPSLLEVVLGPKRVRRYRRKMALAAFYSGASLVKPELRRVAAVGSVLATAGIVLVVT